MNPKKINVCEFHEGSLLRLKIIMLKGTKYLFKEINKVKMKNKIKKKVNVIILNEVKVLWKDEELMTNKIFR